MIKAFACVALLGVSVPLNAQTGVDTAGTAAIVRQATDHSEIMKNLQYLGDIIGPRLSGSTAMRRANDWTAERFRSYGLTTAIEPWDFGVTWERGPVFARLLAPFQRAVTAQSWAWTAGTDGKPLAGPVVLVNVSSPESVAVYRDRMKGAWLLTGQPANIFNPDGPPMTAADSAALLARRNQPRPAQDQSRRAENESGRHKHLRHEANARPGIANRLGARLTHHVAAATPNLRHLEWFHDHTRIESMFFDGTLRPAGGVVRPADDAPGHGLTLRTGDADQYRIR